MKKISTIARAAFKKYLVLLLTILSFSFSQSGWAHSVNGYTASCNAGPTFSLDANVSNVNNSSNYAWQYKNASNVWVCIVNGNNTINGNVYAVSGATSTATTNPAPIVFNNPNSSLQGLIIRCVISDGTGVNPCNMPSGNTWNSDASSVNHTINISGTACAGCSGRVTGLYFNELNNGPDLPITNGATFNVTQLGSLYNLEASTAGTVGSVKFTITGPTSSSNIENTTPYNSPSTGGGAWTGAVGNYTVNLKTFSGAGATSTQCHDTTITFILTTTNCNCSGTNVVLNPGFESGTTNWSWSGGTLAQGTGAVACGSFSGDLNNTSASSKAWQTIGTDLTIGTAVSVSVYAGTHDNTFNNWVAVEFLNSSNVVLGTSVYVPVDKILANAPVGPQLYNFSATVPTGTKYTRVAFGGTGNYTKTDRWCVTLTPPVGTGSIGDRVWYDANGNGIQDATETGGITGVVVQLRNSANTVIATQNTNASGNYLFTGLAAGTYTVVFPVSISGAVVTTANVGADDNIDSDPSQTTGITANIVLASGQNIVNVDAGYCPINLQLGNKVWYDTNNNGINDASENGIRNVTVNLYKDDNNDNIADGASLATVVTDASGNYMFSNLAPGNYIVGAVVPNGYMSSAVNGGDPDNNVDLDDNGQVIAGNEIRGLAITLTGGTEPTSGNINNTYDFGLLPDCNCTTSATNLLINGNFENGTTGWSWSSANGSLTTGTGYIACGAANGFNNQSSGTSKVWQDVNVAAGSTVVFKGFAGTHTPGIACSPTLSLIFLNAANTVLGQSNVTVTRDVDINNSQLEQYAITAVAPAGATKVRVQSSITCNTMKIDAFCLTVTAAPLGSIGDRVWKDTDADGIQDAGEVGVAGITLVLLNSTGQPIATTTTDAFGNYKFSGLPAGDYSVRITPPANYGLSAKTQGGDTNLDSDFDPITYTTGTVNLAAGQNRTDIDAGLKFTQPQPASVGDRVWLDINGDGVQDAVEPGVSNVLVTLYNGSNVAVRYTYTDVNGNYLFTDVTPGNYTVGFSLPPAFEFSPNNGAISGATNSDAIPATGRTASFTVNAGDQITYVDAGLKKQVSTNGSVGDFVWNDLNKDGIQDAAEPGISGVTVRLLNAATNAIIATTTTDITGYYIFNNILPDTFKVEFVTPAGYTTTTQLNSNVAASGTDSDVDPATSRTVKFGLAADQRITTVDAGYWLTTGGTGKIGDRVWLDANQNGIQDAGETNVQGVTVTLYDATNTAIKLAVTDTAGKYLFTDLAAGNYTVGFSNVPQGYTFTTQGLGTAATGSDANPATGKTGTITLAAGQTNLDVDAGIRSMMAGTASIGNRVWSDLNNNGLQDAVEPGIQGVTVELLDGNGNSIDSDPATAGVQPTTRVTNALGEYLFTGLAAGDYKVRFSTLPAGYNASPKAAGTNRDIDSDGNTVAGGTSTTDVVSLAAGEERLDIDFGLFNPTAPLGQIGDFVWFDSNNNGIQDATEQGVPGVTVSLLDASNTVIATTVTDASGLYRFVNLANATYSVKFSNLPAGFVFSPKDLGGNDNTDSDPDPTTGVTGTYTIAAGNTNLTVDAGIYSTRAALGDYVWFDANSNGIQEATEKGIAGITVTLYDAANVAVTSAITDQNGRYFFSNLNPGTYTVGFSTIPTKLAFTLKDVVAAGDAADSDVDPATGKTGPVTLAAGQVNLTVDAGLKPIIPASIGDFVWYDTDRDGIQDAGEPGVPGVIVTLYNAANQPIGAAITDGNGYYLISNVPPGTGYYVVFSNKPSDLTTVWTLQNVGGVAASDNSKADAIGQTLSFDLASGQNITNMDAGFHNSCTAIIKGNVWHDADGMTDGYVDSVSVGPKASIPSNLRASLIDLNTGMVVKNSLVSGLGLFQFNNVAPGGYYILISAINGSVGQFAPNTVLPNGWTYTGEKLGTGPGRDLLINGKLNVTMGYECISNVNFGIKLDTSGIGID